MSQDQCGPMIPDAPITTKNEQDSSPTFRRSRREGIRGSRATNTDGTNTSARLKPIDFGKRSIKIYPLPHMFVVKDLVSDLTNSYAQHKSIGPRLQAQVATEGQELEHFQSKEDRKKPDGLYECILRACCSTSCPSY